MIGTSYRTKESNCLRNDSTIATLFGMMVLVNKICGCVSVWVGGGEFHTNTQTHTKKTSAKNIQANQFVT